MTLIKDVEYYDIFRHPEHCVNQIAMRTLEERRHSRRLQRRALSLPSRQRPDSDDPLEGRRQDLEQADQSCCLGAGTTGNWDCGICELADGTLLVNLTITGFFKRGIKPEQPSWSSHPDTAEWGDWTWAYKTQGWLGTYVVKSNDGGETWSKPIPVNVRPLKHGGCRLGCWQLPNGSILMGLYGRIHGYEEEGEGESTRSALMRSDDGGDNWEYYSTLAYDPASIIDYEEPALLRLKDGRLVCFMRTHVHPSGDAKNMVMTVSEDDGFSWTPPKWLNIWGYPADMIPLLDGRYLMVYGYRRPPYGVRGVISKDGLNWDIKNEFVIREGGVPGKTVTDTPGSSRMTPAAARSPAAASTGPIPASTSISAIRACSRCPMGRWSPPIMNGAPIPSRCSSCSARASGCS